VLELLADIAVIDKQRAKVRREVGFSDFSAAAGSLGCFLSAATSRLNLPTFVVSAVSIASTFFMSSAMSLCVRRKFAASGEVQTMSALRRAGPSLMSRWR